MGIISLTQQDELYWLGRYTERVYTTIRKYIQFCDKMIEQENLYKDFCASMEIPNIYDSPQDFIKRYGYDESNPDSLISNLMRGYDNAIILREVIGSDSLSYIQLAVYAIRRAAISYSPVLELQSVCDNILAFWGMADDSIMESRVRDLIKTGRRIERVDLFARMHYDPAKMKEAIKRLTSYRLVRSGLGCRQERVAALEAYLTAGDLDYQDIVNQVEMIFQA